MIQQHIAELYYIAMNDKNIDTVSSYFHQDITFKSPTSSLSGKDAVVSAAKEYFNAFNSIKVNEIIGEKDKVAVLCETAFSIGNMSSISIINCQDNLIKSIELFFDTGFFQSK